MSHSKGYDGISTEHLKLINKDLSNCLTLIINQSLNSGMSNNEQLNILSQIICLARNSMGLEKNNLLSLQH